jgi:hypothetical protein
LTTTSTKEDAVGAASPVAGIKPAVLDTGSGPQRVMCAMSVPRLGWQDHMFCWPRGLVPYGISPVRLEGAFWGQCLERVLSEMVELDTDPKAPPLWLLTLDYDTIFEQDAVPRMLTYAAASDYDIVAAVQMKRKQDEPLFTMASPDGERKSEMRRDHFVYHNIVKANTAHFGFTMIRAAALKKMPHPWFLGKPDSEGTWGPERTDDDIHFWQVAQKAGLKSGVCTRVCIGHAEVWIKWPSSNMKCLLQHPGDFWESGGRPPEEAWK